MAANVFDVMCVGNMVVGEWTATCDACGHVCGKRELDDFGDSPHRPLQKWDCKRDGCMFSDGKCSRCDRVLPVYAAKPPIDWKYLDDIRAGSKKAKKGAKK